ncbi:MAG: ABC transporter permease subunit [Spirochaetes bacterium]|nr:ABC transporter permease subunit [Spirochaetota bacterium]
MISMFSLMLSLKILLSAVPLLLLSAFLVSYAAVGAGRTVRVMLDFFTNMPLIFPPMATGFLMVHFLGGEGAVGRMFKFDLMFTRTGLVIAAFIAGFPFIAQCMVNGVDAGLYRLCEASYSLGKGKTVTFFRVVIPSLKRNIISGMLLASARILGEVGMSLMIGGNISGKTNTVSLEIYNAVLDGNNQQAFAFSLMLFIFSGSVFICIKMLNYSESG